VKIENIMDLKCSFLSFVWSDKNINNGPILLCLVYVTSDTNKISIYEFISDKALINFSVMLR